MRKQKSRSRAAFAALLLLEFNAHDQGFSVVLHCRKAVPCRQKRRFLCRVYQKAHSLATVSQAPRTASRALRGELASPMQYTSGKASFSCWYKALSAR